MPGSRFHPYSPDEVSSADLKMTSTRGRLVSAAATTSHQAPSHSSITIEESFAQSSSIKGDKAPINPRLSILPSRPASTPLAVAVGESEFGLAAYHNWSMIQNLHAMEQQQLVQLQQQWRQQLLIPQQNLVYTAGNTQEYIRYMNELRHMSIFPVLPTSPVPISRLSPVQDQPLNLSLKDNFVDKDSTGGSSGASSIHSSSYSLGSHNSHLKITPPSSSEKPKCCKRPSPEKSPHSIRLHPTKPIEVGSLDPGVAKMFPHLRSTDMGSVVLWNFLWALLADDNYKGVITWIDRPSLKFRVLQPQALARLWGPVKKNMSMNWKKLMKVIDLYLNKDILRRGNKKLVFKFVLVPQSAGEMKKEQ